MSNFKKSGNGILSIQLFTQTTVSNRPSQWAKRFNYRLNHSLNLLLSAPTGFTDTSWDPGIISRGDMGSEGATAIIALRPGDPFFELRNVDTGISKRIVIERNFHLTNIGNLAATKTWLGSITDLDSSGSLVNRQYFEAFAAQLENRSWNKYLIKAQFYNN